MIITKKWLCLTALSLVACTGQDVSLGDGGPSAGSSEIGEVSEDGGSGGGSSSVEDAGFGCGGGCASGELCCFVTVDPVSCASGTQCLAVSSCPPAACASGSSGGDAGSIAESDAGTSVEPDAGEVEAEDAGTGTGVVGCGGSECVAGQDCCIVTLDVQTCKTGLQCVWGGCPPAPCDSQSDQ